MAGQNDVLEKIDEKLDKLILRVETYISSSEHCRKRCSDVYSAVYGNGTIGLKTKVFILWGAMVIVGGIAVSAIAAALSK